MCGHRVGEGNKMESYKIMAWWWKPFTPSPPLYCGWRTIQAEADYWYLQYTARNTFTRTLEYTPLLSGDIYAAGRGRVLFSLANGLILMTRMTRWCWCWWQWSTELTIWEMIPWVWGIYSSRQPFWFGCRLVFSNLNWWLIFLVCVLNHLNWWHFFGTGSTTHYCYSLFESLWSQLMIPFWYLGILELKCSCIMTHDGGIFCLDTAIFKIPHNIKV